MANPLPAVEPMPGRVGGLPLLGAGPSLLRDPTAFFARSRARHGDRYVVDAFGYRLFCVFSPEGVRQLYAFAEEEASFGLATFELVFRRKNPLELLIGRRNRPHDLFGKQDVETYLETMEDVVARQMEELGSAGSFEAFALARRIGHRVGLAGWAGEEAATPPTLDRLIPLLDRMDSAASFVDPIATLVTKLSNKRRERRAMHAVEEIFAEILARRAAAPARPGDFLDTIWNSFADLPPGEREVHTARDVMVIHMGAQSNLYAALAWTLVNLLLYPEHLARVRAGDDEWLERCANESIRLAQRSLTLRRVMKPITLEDGGQSYRLSPGVMLATMLSVTNTSSAPGLDRFDPLHYEGRRLAARVEIPARELVSTFGHGRHSCPAQRFSISAIRIAIRGLLDRFELTPRFDRVEPRRRQLGAIARAEAPCLVDYRPR